MSEEKRIREQNCSDNMSEMKFDYTITTMQHNYTPFSRLSFINLTNN